MWKFSSRSAVGSSELVRLQRLIPYVEILYSSVSRYDQYLRSEFEIRDLGAIASKCPEPVVCRDPQPGQSTFLHQLAFRQCKRWPLFGTPPAADHFSRSSPFLQVDDPQTSRRVRRWLSCRSTLWLLLPRTCTEHQQKPAHLASEPRAQRNTPKTEQEPRRQIRLSSARTPFSLRLGDVHRYLAAAVT